MLYERYGHLIFRFLFRFLGSAEIAEDLTHDCFMNLIGGSEKSQSAAFISVRNRLYSDARDLAMGYFRTPALVEEVHLSPQGVRFESVQCVYLAPGH